MVTKCREEYFSVYKPMCDKLAEERRKDAAAMESAADIDETSTGVGRE